jgi:hypothetical protein
MELFDEKKTGGRKFRVPVPLKSNIFYNYSTAQANYSQKNWHMTTLSETFS